LNLASALIKQIIAQKDIETWGALREHYLPGEFHSLFTIIDKHVDSYSELPSFDDLTLSIRDKTLEEKVYAIQSVEVDADAWNLLEYLKNEYTQILVLDELDKYIETSIAMSSSLENVEHLHSIIQLVEEKVDLEDPAESMQSMDLFDSDDELAKFTSLGLNQEFDLEYKFHPTSLVLAGGRRGSGKSITCSNIANNVYEGGRTALYYTIEMTAREIMQRQCAIGTGVNLTRLELKNLSNEEWNLVGSWWAGRFEDSDTILNEFKLKYDFEEFHKKLTKHPIIQDRMLDIIYAPELSINALKRSLDVKMMRGNVGVIVVDYINQITARNVGKLGQYDWTQQIEIAKELKKIAQKYEVMVYSAYQTDASGEARFSKGILDACDAAYSLENWTPEDNCFSFNCVKRRGAPEVSFHSEIDWPSLKIGPKSAMNPAEKQKLKDEMENDEDAEEVF